MGTMVNAPRAGTAVLRDGCVMWFFYWLTVALIPSVSQSTSTSIQSWVNELLGAPLDHKVSGGAFDIWRVTLVLQVRFRSCICQVEVASSAHCFFILGTHLGGTCVRCMSARSLNRSKFSRRCNKTLRIGRRRLASLTVATSWACHHEYHKSRTFGIAKSANIGLFVSRKC